MDIQQNKQLVTQGYEKFRAGDIDGLLQLFAEDAEWIGMEVEPVSFSGDYHGRQGIAQFFSDLSQAQEAESFEPREMIAEGDRVVVLGRAKWRVRATGKSYDEPWAHCFTIRDGKVVRFEQYYDTAATRAAFLSDQMPLQSGAGAGTTATPLH